MAAFELEGLVKRFNDFQLGPLSLTMEPEAVLAYIGPNGAGKSTTMHCMMGLLSPEEGSVAFYGRPNDINKPAWKHDVGYVGDQQPFYEHWLCETAGFWRSSTRRGPMIWSISWWLDSISH